MKKATKREVRDAIVMRVTKYGCYPVKGNGVVESEKVSTDMVIKAFIVLDEMMFKREGGKE